jgi:hypothetical protein
VISLLAKDIRKVPRILGRLLVLLSRFPTLLRTTSNHPDPNIIENNIVSMQSVISGASKDPAAAAICATSSTLMRFIYLLDLRHLTIYVIAGVLMLTSLPTFLPTILSHPDHNINHIMALMQSATFGMGMETATKVVIVGMYTLTMANYL